MPKPKEKSAKSTRASKPKKKLGLTIRPALRLPHEDLIRQPEPDPYSKQPDLSDQIEIKDLLKIENPPPATVNVSLAQSELSSASLARNEPSSEKAKPRESLAQNELSSEKAKLIFSQASGYKSLNYFDDVIMPRLSPPEQIVMRRLYRLSYGFNRNTTDSVSLNKLAEKCNLGDATIKRAIKSLTEQGFIKVHSDKSRDPNGGNRYSVLISVIESLAQSELSSEKAKLKASHIKDDDHDLNKQDHHQSAHALATMTIYQSITGNPWSKADLIAYEKIQQIPIDTIEQAIRIANDRAASQPRSLAYFVKEILTTANPKPASRTQQRRQLQAIIEQVRTSHAGQANYTIADFSADVKDACAREGVVFDHRLFNELIEKPNSKNP